MGRSLNRLSDDTDLTENLPVRSRYRVINHVTTTFWNRWCTLVSPGLVVRQKWHKKSRNLQIGDLVMIADLSKIKSKYKLAIVDEVKVSTDGCVRSAVVRYYIQRGGSEKWTPEKVTRSVQRLILILPVEEQDTPVMVKDLDTHAQVCMYTSPVKVGV